MAECWHLVCDKTKEQLWIGQGNEGINLYSGDEKVMNDLEEFLRETAGNPIVLVNDQDERSFMYDRFKKKADPKNNEKHGFLYSLGQLIRRYQQYRYDKSHPTIPWGM